MQNRELCEFEAMSQEVGKLTDFVQGGGGNTSVKISNKLMAVKASGFKLKQITTEEGFVVINYMNIKEYYENVNLNSDVDFEKESVEVARDNVVEIEGLKVLRPSVEAGFHSILKKYVIHTHPVYANILCCSVEGKGIAEKIFKDKEYSFLWIPYINPGFCLTLKIKDEIRNCIKEKGQFPEVIFMEKHGLIVNSDNYERALELHSEVNHLIKEELGIKEAYPEIVLERAGEDLYKSKTAYLNGFFKENKVEKDFLEKVVLYPDQLVYLNESVSIDGGDNKLKIDLQTGELLYRASLSEAQTIEETLLAYLYVVDNIKAAGMRVNSMTPVEIDFIKNWESEAYRKSLVKNLTE